MLLLREHTACEVALNPADLRAVMALARGNQDSCVLRSVSPTGTGHHVVVPGSFVGRLRLPSGLVLDIRSRFPLTDLAALLAAYVGSPALLRDDCVPAGEDAALIDFIAVAFVEALEALIGRGLPKGYVERTFVRPPFAGRPDVTAHLRRHAGRTDRLITHAQRLTTDVATNQVIAWAHDLLLRAPLRLPLVRTRLMALAPALTAITRPLEVSRSIGRARARVPTRAQNAFDIAVLVIRGTSVLPHGVTRDGAAILFPMPKVWEAFVERVVTDEAPSGRRIARQVPVTITDPPNRTVGYADVVEYEDSGLPAVVHDAKYKTLNHRPGTDDLYQVFTYCRRLGARHGVLALPGRGERTAFTMGDVTIEQRGLPVLMEGG